VSTPKSGPPSKPDKNEAPRVYGLDLNEHWQADRDHYDNQKINGLTLARAIRQSAFTQKLDIEGRDPLSFPVAAVLYQQASNHCMATEAGSWSGTSPDPDGDIAAVVFATELLTQLRNRGGDLDRVSQIRARQDGKMLDKTSNTKHAAQIIAEHIQGWLPTCSVDPDSQHEITSLCNQLAELRREDRSWALQ